MGVCTRRGSKPRRRLGRAKRRAGGEGGLLASRMGGQSLLLRSIVPPQATGQSSRPACLHHMCTRRRSYAQAFAGQGLGVDRNHSRLAPRPHGALGGSALGTAFLWVEDRGLHPGPLGITFGTWESNVYPGPWESVQANCAPYQNMEMGSFGELCKPRLPRTRGGEFTAGGSEGCCRIDQRHNDIWFTKGGHCGIQYQSLTSGLGCGTHLPLPLSQ